MESQTVASHFLSQEARAMLTRLERVMPFALNMPMVNAATVSTAAGLAIEKHLARKRRELGNQVHGFLRWLNSSEGRQATAKEAQRLFTLLRLKFNTVLDQLDIFADVLTQRSEHEIGVWLAGLDAVAADALTLPGNYYKPPPLICYLDRGHGAAIRRARTRLPGGSKNPVAIIRVPRERMVGSGIASSLVHEVGHQGSILLDLINSFRPTAQKMQKEGGKEAIAWRFLERWLSEILADFWSVARVGVASTLGLIGVVSLPRWFVFRVNVDDPHPIPWIRVKLSCALGQALYPHPQWSRLAKLWDSFYPTTTLDEDRQRLFSILQATLPRFVTLLVNHRPKALRGRSLGEAISDKKRQPARLSEYYRSWRDSPVQIRSASPTLVFAVIGQARADGKMSPEDESWNLANLLKVWALGRSLERPAIRVPRSTARVAALGR